jgi:hypothetical protein
VNKAEKQRRSEIKRRLRERERETILSSLPIPLVTLKELFSYLETKEGEYGCDNTLRATLEFIENENLPKDSLINWLNEHGGYCDCEVLANVEETIDG